MKMFIFVIFVPIIFFQNKKVVKRSQLKGKFHELLENEIKVLRTCNNENIIKLYDLKKTANNFYLILEYCNEGDL